MKKIVFLFFVIFLTLQVYSQSIRKNYSEMTDQERIDLVNAFYQLRLGGDLINDLAQFHADFFNFDGTATPEALDIHFNLPDEPERDIFLAWHRRQMFELEQAMQDINPDISMPFWDSSTDQSANSPLWDESFMGQFDEDWQLNRAFGSVDLLPTPTEVSDVQAETNFLDYSDDFERGTPHTGAHQWVGGFMPTSSSPRDPIFYLHHTYVDKLWDDWHEVNQNSSFIRTSMLRYDGTYIFDGTLLPLVNPNDIVNTRSLGVFYADNQLAMLDNYTVSNIYNDLESFYYQYTIQASNNFTVPTGGNCKFESVNEIILQPGFEAEAGSSFTASIDPQNFSKSRRTIVRNQIPFDSNVDMTNVYALNEDTPNTINKFSVFPNPFENVLNINRDSNGEITNFAIYNLLGRKVKESHFNSKSKNHVIHMNFLPSGIYILKLYNNDELVFTGKIIKI